MAGSPGSRILKAVRQVAATDGKQGGERMRASAQLLRVLYSLTLCVFVFVHACTGHTHEELRRELVGVSSLLPVCGWVPGIWSFGLEANMFTS